MEEFSQISPVVHTVALSSIVLIDQDLLVEILKRLPIKTLARFLCVSKVWKALISSTRFIKLQFALARSATPPPNLKPYIRFKRQNKSVFDRHRPQPHNSLVETLNPPFPFQSNTIPMPYFVDSIRGLVCVSYSTNSAFDSTILWNPAIHKYVKLPLLQSPAHKFVHRLTIHCSVIGFGYNASSNDFIVVRVCIPPHSVSKSVEPKYEVYSSRAGMWTEGATSDVLQTCFRLGCDGETGCLLNGNINWIVRGKGGSYKPRVLMFNCETQMFRTVEIPPEIFENHPGKKLNVMEYAGMLSLGVNFWEKHAFELWVMDDTSTFWKKLYTFKNDKCEINDDSFMNLAPYGPKQWCEWGGSRPGQTRAGPPGPPSPP